MEAHDYQVETESEECGSHVSVQWSEVSSFNWLVTSEYAIWVAGGIDQPKHCDMDNNGLHSPALAQIITVVTGNMELHQSLLPAVVIIGS